MAKENVKNTLGLLYEIAKMTDPNLQKLWNEAKKKRRCTTCANCKRIIIYPGFVLAEEHICAVGLECDTILNNAKDCEQYIEGGTWEE